jgi:hypothetical protein
LYVCSLKEDPGFDFNAFLKEVTGSFKKQKPDVSSQACLCLDALALMAAAILLWSLRNKRLPSVSSALGSGVAYSRKSS